MVKQLPPGNYEARLLNMVSLPAKVANELQGCDVWKEL